MFVEELRIELLGTGIKVTEIVPGRVRTNLYYSALGPERAEAELYAKFRPLEPGDIAEAVAYALSQPDRVNVSRIEIFPTDQAMGGSVAYKELS